MPEPMTPRMTADDIAADGFEHPATPRSGGAGDR
jgi:hypothetical protein